MANKKLYSFSTERLWAKPSDLPGVKRVLRQKLATISYIEVRRKRLPIYTALARELLEEGCIEAADNFQRLADQENYLITTRVIRTPISKYGGMLLALHENIRLADIACKKKKVFICIRTLFQCAYMVERKGSDHFWLVKEIFYIIKTLFDRYKHPKGLYEMEARVCYFYGKFLLNQVKEYIEAIVELTVALKLSKGKEWPTIKGSTNLIFVYSTNLICKALLLEAENIYERNPEKAESYTCHALTHLTDACLCLDIEFYCEIFLKRTHYLIYLKRFSEALKFHRKFLPYIYASSTPKFKCELFYQQGLCFKALHNNLSAIRRFKQSMRLGEIYNILTYKANGLAEIGKIYSEHQSTYEFAMESLNEAMYTYLLLQDKPNYVKANFSKSILKSQVILPDLVRLIKVSDQHFDKMLRLQAWKNCLIPFWQGEEEEEEGFEEEEMGEEYDFDFDKEEPAKTA